MEPVDLRRYLDDHGQLVRGRGTAVERWGEIARHASLQVSGTSAQIPIPCSKRPARRRCPGFLSCYRQDAPPRIRWHCPVCGDGGTIVGWQGTPFDLRVLVGFRDGGAASLEVPVELHSALRDFADGSPECMGIAYGATVEGNRIVLRVPPALRDHCAQQALEAAQLAPPLRSRQLMQLAAQFGPVGRGDRDHFDVDFEMDFDVELGPHAMDVPACDAFRSFHVRATLQEASPAVWRTIVMPAELDLTQVSQALSVLMGMAGAKAHTFHVGERAFAVPVPKHSRPDALGECGMRLVDIAPIIGSRFRHCFESGCRRELDVVVESIAAKPCFWLRCVEGAGCLPPDDFDLATVNRALARLQLLGPYA